MEPTVLAGAWAAAQRLWGVRMSAPLIESGPDDTFAWFTFPARVHVDLALLTELGLTAHLDTVFAHEIGHHVLAPSTPIGHRRVKYQLGRALLACGAPDDGRLPAVADRLANLWSDLLINTRIATVQRAAAPAVDELGGEPGMVAMWRALSSRWPAVDAGWWLVLRAYEILFRLPAASLAAPEPPPIAGLDPVVDARLLAELVAGSGLDPVGGSLPFGMLYAPYLVATDPDGSAARWRAAPRGEPAADCGVRAGGGPPTAAELEEMFDDPRLRDVPRHPALTADPDDAEDGAAATGGQAYGPAQTLKLLPGADPDQVAAAWYRAQARRWVRPLRVPDAAAAPSVALGATELWEAGDELGAVDWAATLIASPKVVPGVTTRRRVALPETAASGSAPVRLDLYIDSSGSMPAPLSGSPALLAGAVLLASVLRGGGRVRVTSFSGRGQVAGAPTFGRNPGDAMSGLLAYFGGGTVFPLDLLAERYAAAPAEPTHLVALSDDGLASMFGAGEQRDADAARRIRPLLVSATLLLAVPAPTRVQARAEADGYRVVYLPDLASAPRICAEIAAEMVAGATGRGDR